MSELDNTNVIIRKFEPVLNGLSFHELTILNKMVVDRIRTIQKAGALVSMSKFNVGDRVAWQGKDGMKRTGIITRLNHKTASVKTGNEGYWNVSPQLLTREN
ncbi:MAG: hypothetical protein HY841_03855 [Bacteroidetes bacterium]|nr:hypothetical protein [Bacteroidota bacterium]